MDKDNVVKVLLLGVGGNVSQGILKALHKSEINLYIVGACISSRSKGLYMCDEAMLCPYAADDDFISWVIATCKEKHIDIIMTGVEENIIELAKYKVLIEAETNAIFVSPSFEKLRIGQDKYLTCEWLRKNECNHPKYMLWSKSEDIEVFSKVAGYPIIAKPRHGKSASGIYVIHNEREAKKYSNLEGYVLEEYIGDSDKEYTVGCYLSRDKRNVYIIAMHRLLKNGTTVWAKTVHDPVIEEEAKKICLKYKPNGPLNIQMRMSNDNKPICFELNVRFSGTTAIRANFGFEDVKAQILEYVFNQGDISNCFNIIDGEVFRYDEELYLKSGTVEKMDEYGEITNVGCFRL